ncbi:Heterokaryon incompatibility protein 6, OR allele [Colletotrichum tanaceti]|uniref:Heterokaryon incompatibility protein 6, OR allele n=1 Tax=Colletotrichum tanaceti TaxID=1306861 RepID=A0A4U6X8V0_9PEZI|nr:Heterokaryon incompatibility protein 6, OR allele [Colletotrichum tanaceti]TKW51825.1 Heterokaryon incompatibility protein 6, OR allele [Colletotrichum tanaceti]
MESSQFRTTYQYSPLPTENHVRLLKIPRPGSESGTRQAAYKIVEIDLSATPPEFEAISYTWGNPARVSSLPIEGCPGTIGLTKHLAQAWPHLEKHCTTGYLWIDQICIDQSSKDDKAHQIGRMAQIYSAAKRVIVWLGPEDESSRLCRQWLSEVDTMLRKLPNSHVTMRDSPTFNSDVRLTIVRSTFGKQASDAIYVPAIRRWWLRPWFTRGWVVQELLRAADVLFVAGDAGFTLRDLAELQTVPPEKPLSYAGDVNVAYDILLNLKAAPYEEEQPLRFLRIMAQVAEEFTTSELADNLYAFLGMIEGAGFAPNYDLSIRHNFTAFAVSLARSFGSLDFLSLWSANLDLLLPDTPEALRDFPSWVPSYSGTPLSAPFRLAAGGSRTFRNTVAWNAASGRRHAHNQPEDAVATGRLRVRGRVIDHIGVVSATRIARCWDTDAAYLDSLVEQIRDDLPGSPFADWTPISLVAFLNTASANGNTPRETPEEVLGLAPREWGNELVNLNGYNESLAACLAMAKGRKIAVTERGRMGMVPWIGSKGRSGEERGSVIVALHGCCVPIVLEPVGGDEYKVLGDCYIKGVMHGEAVVWEDEDADTFILI